ncbi:hypothetical protein ABB37_07850 [Leptomonas pyrrhocoris]|uniref:Uncharacterized protein n=1 Tax=Leptomonas pyrrhocoris TaxID=157538 RepID=A0A0N0DSV7_LEPPY|nr:hypothetical protein ABB37_07850 [Leptomonas pyrrhocoris]KPA76564.1 hypothetical protein ABB37_07850 [Leptomonas pyrrhocoris]|eukprot:XP_015655003.1 hypothetical protein ABB37_07850 [Leptomonas pyrrhocoris]
MSATEPLTHVTVRGRHFFIPRSLTNASSLHATGYTDGDDVPMVAKPVLTGQREPDVPTAEEHRVLHELLAAVVLSASCRCGGIDGSLGGTEFSEDSGGVTNLSPPRTLSATTAAGLNDSLSSSTTSYTAASPEPSKPSGAPATPSNCAKAQRVAFAVAVILLSCALLRTARDT